MSNNLGFRGGKNWAQASAGVQETEFAGGGGGAGGVDQFLPPYTALPWESAFGRIDGSLESS